jgi:predicted nucleic acid-binding protein
MDEPIFRVVADSDVLVMDIMAECSSRKAMGIVRSVGEIELIASKELLDEAETVICLLSSKELSKKWRDRMEMDCEIVDQIEGDNSALSSAYLGGAQHIISCDDRLTSSKAGVIIKDRFEVSIKRPHAFVNLFDLQE